MEDLLEHVKAVHKESLIAKAEKAEKDADETQDKENDGDKIDQDTTTTGVDDDGDIDPVQLAMTKKVGRVIESNLI